MMMMFISTFNMSISRSIYSKINFVQLLYEIKFRLFSKTQKSFLGKSMVLKFDENELLNELIVQQINNMFK